jgi:hypothetical protein
MSICLFVSSASSRCLIVANSIIKSIKIGAAEW